MKKSRFWRRVFVVALALPIANFVLAQVESPSPDPSELPPAQQQLYTQLEESLSGATLVGRFAITGEDSGELNEERYELKNVEHITGDQWLFHAGIRYGEHDVVIPLTVPVKWADDTPVISIDKMMIPGLGTYTARVMIYEDHYVGFWSGGDHGGHMFGLVERSGNDDDDSQRETNEQKENGTQELQRQE